MNFLVRKQLPCVAVCEYSCSILIFFAAVHTGAASFLDTSAAMQNEAVGTVTAIHAMVILAVIHCPFASFGTRCSAVFIHHILGTWQCYKRKFHNELVCFIQNCIIYTLSHTSYKILNFNFINNVHFLWGEGV